MNTTMDQPQMFIATQPIFDDQREAQMAFIRGQLPWVPNQSAVMLRQRRGKIVGHQQVVIKDVFEIDTDGQPVYVVENRFGEFVTVPGGMLSSMEDLLYDDKGQMTVYHTWLVGEIQRQNERLMMILRNPPPATGVLIIPE